MDALLAELARWEADSRADEAARSKSRERWMRQQAVESARFAGVMLDLAEQRSQVTVHTAAGGRVHGRIRAVGRDFCLVEEAGGIPVLLALTGMVGLRPHARKVPPASSERVAPLDTDLGLVLAGLAAERPRVRVVTAGGGEPLAGELRAVGEDVATLRLDGAPPSTIYLRLASLREVTLLG
jgi:hypothetical protein